MLRDKEGLYKLPTLKEVKMRVCSCVTVFVYLCLLVCRCVTSPYNHTLLNTHSGLNTYDCAWVCMCARVSESSGVYLFGRVCECESVFVREIVNMCARVCVFIVSLAKLSQGSLANECGTIFPCR